MVRRLGAGLWAQARTLPPALFHAGACLFLGAVCALSRRRECVRVVCGVFVRSVCVCQRAMRVGELYECVQCIRRLLFIGQ